MKDRLIIGAMSGTSADGVDATILRVMGRGISMQAELIDFIETPYPDTLRKKILQIRAEKSVTLNELAELAKDVSLAYCNAVQQLLKHCQIQSAAVRAIGAHGQTLFHAPPLTIQWIDGALLAQTTGLDVVTDFRRADCAVGGQGAPLVPFADWIMFRSETVNRVILNIGGIANITILPKDCSIDEVTGFDTGPGNCVSDWLMRDNGGFDPNGDTAASGQVHLSLLPKLMAHPYFARLHPKSTDGPEMIEAFQQAVVGTNLSLEDSLATALAFTVAAIEKAIADVGWDWKNCELIVAGGGVRNRTLMSMIRNQCAQVRTSDEWDIPCQAREAMAFGILAAATLDRLHANVLRVTGASRSVVLGAIYPH